MPEKLLTEPELISLILAKDKRGAEALFDHYSPVLQVAIIRRVQNRECVENILENAFVRIWLNTALFLEQDKPLLAWMLGMVRIEIAQYELSVKTENFVQPANGFDTGLQLGI